MSDIAHLEQMTAAIDTAAKFFRVMKKAGLSFDHLVLPLDDRTARHNLVAYMKAGCPTLDALRTAPKSLQPKLLVPDGHYSAVEISKHHDPDPFWQTRSGLYVHGDFRTRIVAAAKPTEAGKTFKKLPRFKLGCRSTGEEMRAARPRSIWTATDFCPWLAVKLAKQPSGEDGELLANGYASLFLVEGAKGEVFVVRVVRHDTEWGVGAWHLSNGWADGIQFGSRN